MDRGSTPLISTRVVCIGFESRPVRLALGKTTAWVGCTAWLRVPTRVGVGAWRDVHLILNLRGRTHGVPALGAVA